MTEMQMTVKKEIETIRRSQEELENSFADTKAELKAMNRRMNNAEERMNDLSVHALITWLSCTDHGTGHALMTWLFGH